MSHEQDRVKRTDASDKAGAAEEKAGAAKIRIRMWHGYEKGIGSFRKRMIKW